MSWVGGGWVVGGGWTRQTHFMVGPGRGPTKNKSVNILIGSSAPLELVQDHLVCSPSLVKEDQRLKGNPLSLVF